MTTSDDTSERLARVEDQLRQVTGRLAALEQAQPAGRAPGTWAPGPGPDVRQQAGPEPADAGEPTFAYSGRGQIGGRPIAVHGRARMSDVMEADPEQIAKVFAALASPARITVLRALLDGPRTSQQLRAELDDASVGQLYHHLRELMAAGLIIQPARSRYAIRRGSLVVLCVQIATAANLAGNAPGSAVPEEDPPGADAG